MSFYNLGMERAVLASAFYTGDISHISDSQEDFFYIPEHRRIKEMLIDMSKNNMPINYELIDEKTLSRYGISETAMLEIQSTNPIQVDNFVKSVLLEHAAKRKVHAVLVELMSALNNHSSIDVSRMLGETSEDLREQFTSGQSGFEMVSIDAIEEPPVEFIGEDFLPLPKRSVVIMAGRGGVGKSSIALQCAIKHVKRTGEKAFCWFSEDPLGETKNRAHKICLDLGIGLSSMHGKLLVSNAKPFNVAINMDGNITTNPALAKLKEATKDFSLVILDPFRSFASNFDENSNSDMDNVTKEFASWAKKENKTIILIHHASKEGDIRGASSIVDAVRLAYTVRPAENEGMRWVEITKDNFGVVKLLGANRLKVTTLKD